MEFLDFRQFENLLGFEDPTLGKEQIGEVAIGFGNSFGIGRLEISGERAIAFTNGFRDINRLFVEDNR